MSKKSSSISYFFARDGSANWLKEKKTLLKLKNMLDKAPPVRDFVESLKAAYSSTGLPGLITEVKKVSPSIGVLRDDFDPGSIENLEAIRIYGVQIYYARVKGADAILLITTILPHLDIKCTTKICKLLGLTAIVEVHYETKMDHVLEIEGIELVGINNRDLVLENSRIRRNERKSWLLNLINCTMT